MMVTSRVGVAIVSTTLRSMSVNDLPNCSQNQAIPPGPAGWPSAGAWSVKVTSYLSSSGRDASRILAKASSVACPPSGISVATGALLSVPPPLPMAAVNHLIEGPPVWPEDGSERSVGRITQGHHVGAGVVGRNAEDPPAGLLVADGRMAAADPQVGGGQQHGHGRLAQVVLIDRQVPRGLRLGKDQDDRRLGSC